MSVRSMKYSGRDGILPIGDGHGHRTCPLPSGVRPRPLPARPLPVPSLSPTKFASPVTTTSSTSSNHVSSPAHPTSARNSSFSLPLNNTKRKIRRLPDPPPFQIGPTQCSTPIRRLPAYDHNESERDVIDWDLLYEILCSYVDEEG